MSSLMYLCFSMILIHSTTASDVEFLVYNGDGFRPDVHNYLVFLHIYDSPEGGGMCSGSIIHKEWIITAAHCIRENTKQIKILQQFGSKERVIGFARDYAKPPNFIHTENDLALVRTAKPIKFNAYTQPIALSRLCAFGQQGIITGYGASEFGMGIPLEGTVVVTQCESPGTSRMLLCSQSSAYIDNGDSGGALKTDDGLVGVATASITPPAGRESIFVNISLHFRWIEQVTGIKPRVTSCDNSCGC